MAYSPLPDQALLRQLLDYDPQTGVMTWRRRPAAMFAKGRFHAEASAACWNGAFAGKRAFYTDTGKGYHRGLLLRRSVLAHRVIWKWWYGTEPDQVDHLNHITTDNRLCNLRDASPSVNRRNQQRSRANSSGYTGVIFHKRDRRWQANIRDGGRKVHLGYFATFDEAVEARKLAETKFGYLMKERVRSA